MSDRDSVRSFVVPREPAPAKVAAAAAHAPVRERTASGRDRDEAWHKANAERMSLSELMDHMAAAGPAPTEEDKRVTADEMKHLIQQLGVVSMRRMQKDHLSVLVIEGKMCASCYQTLPPLLPDGRWDVRCCTLCLENVCRQCEPGFFPATYTGRLRLTCANCIKSGTLEGLDEVLSVRQKAILARRGEQPSAPLLPVPMLPTA